MNLIEAFRALDSLNEETFDVSDDGVKKLAEFEQSDDLVDEISVYDLDAEDEEELKDSYIGKVILDCSVCHSKLYKDKEEVSIDEEQELANVGEECPFCYSVDGYKVVGQVVPMTEDKHADDCHCEETAEENSGETFEESKYNKKYNSVLLKEDWSKGVLVSMTIPLSEIEKAADESKINIPAYNDGKWGSTTSLRVYGFPDSYGMVDEDKGIFELNTNFYDSNISKELGSLRDFNRAVVKNDFSIFETYVNDYIRYLKSMLKQKGINVINTEVELRNDDKSVKKSFNEAVEDEVVLKGFKNRNSSMSETYTIGNEIEKYQKWVDYDMKRYGKVSEQTEKDIKEAGLQLIKDQYGDYQVSAGHYKAESLDEVTSDIKKEDIIDWLSEHDQAFEDAKSHFNSEDLSEVDEDSLMDWIQDHDQLSKDFDSFFDIESLDEAVSNLKKRKEIAQKIAEAESKKDLWNLITKVSSFDLMLYNQLMDIADLDLPWKDRINKICNKLVPNKKNESADSEEYCPLCDDTSTDDVEDESLDEATALSDIKGTVGNVLTNHKRELSSSLDSESLISLLVSLKDEVKDDQRAYFDQVIDRVRKLPYPRALQYVYNLILKGDNLSSRLVSSLDESVEEVEVKTDDQKIEVTSDEDGKVTITTEPCEDHHEDEEVMEPVSDETIAEIESSDEDEEEVDVDIDSFDEETFDELGESYFKTVYNNVDSYKTTSSKIEGNTVMIEGIITFDSGSKRKTSFLFEAKDMNRKGKIRFLGENKQLTRGSKAFTILTKLNDKKLMVESLGYNYKTKDNIGKSTLVHGTIKKGK